MLFTTVFLTLQGLQINHKDAKCHPDALPLEAQVVRSDWEKQQACSSVVESRRKEEAKALTMDGQCWYKEPEHSRDAAQKSPWALILRGSCSVRRGDTAEVAGV